MLYGMSFFSLGQGPAGRSQEINYALQIAEDDLETAVDSGFFGTFSEAPTGFTSSSGVAFTRTRTVTVNGGFFDKCKTVLCVVVWNSPSSGGVVQKISLSTVVTDLYPWP